MYTLLLLVGCLGLFCLYNTSKRIRLSPDGRVESYLQAYPDRSKLLGTICLFITASSLVLMDGVFMGIIHLFLVLMVAGCYIIGLAPFRIFKWMHILGLVMLGLFFELLIF